MTILRLRYALARADAVSALARDRYGSIPARLETLPLAVLVDEVDTAARRIIGRFSAALYGTAPIDDLDMRPLGLAPDTDDAVSAALHRLARAAAE